MGLGTIFRKRAHQAAALVGILQAVEEHVIQHPPMPHAVAAAGPVKQIRRVGHAFHAACHHHIHPARHQPIVGQNRRFHARPAHFVQRGATGALVQARAQRGLARRCLPKTG